MYNAKNNYQVILVVLMLLASTLCAHSQRLSDYRILINKATDEDSTISMFDNDSCFFRLADSGGMVMKSNLYDVEWQVWLEHLSGKKVGIGFGHDPAAGKLKITPQFFGLGIPAYLEYTLVVWCDDSIADIPYVKGTVLCLLKRNNNVVHTYQYDKLIKMKVFPPVPNIELTGLHYVTDTDEESGEKFYYYKSDLEITYNENYKNFEYGLISCVEDDYPVPFGFGIFNSSESLPIVRHTISMEKGWLSCFTRNDYGTTTSRKSRYNVKASTIGKVSSPPCKWHINGNDLNFSNELPIRNVTIYNIQGKRVFSKNDVTDESIHLDKGVYLLQITTDKTTTSKFIIK